MTWQHLLQLTFAGGWTALAICLGYWLAIYGDPVDEVEDGHDGGGLVGTERTWDDESLTFICGERDDIRQDES